MDGKSRSPLKDKPLRHAGQSIEEEKERLFEDQLQPYIFYAGVFLAFALVEWWRWYTNMKPSPLLFSTAAAIAIALAVWRFYRIRARMRALRLGLEGEKVVGQFLEGLRARGYSVFHDVVAPGFNVDHVLIGPAGIFSVETKTWSKPLQGDARIRFDGERLTVADREPDRDPVIQAIAQASWLKHLIAESTGRTIHVFPVVLFPGWFVEQAEGSFRQIWVLEPKALPAFLENAPQRLEPSDAKLAGYHLSRFIRSVERERAT